MKKIITISREFGAGGAKIGKAVAERLGYYYMDKDMIIKSAMESSSITADEFSKWDEKVPHNFGFGQSLFDFYNKPLNEKLFEAQKEAIKKVAEKGNCVIVGRNANVVLKEFDAALHVFITSSTYWKLQNLKGLMPEVSEEKILNQMKSIDKARAKYCSYYTDTEFGKAEFYDLCLKSSDLGIEKCVDIICDIAK
ncbi:MAG: cytidylate kinase-like family protein [Lachnospiraceae bacterium]|nr:cytidylate kinase-like family protein [Candidatus Colinaster scatohippi]